MPDMNLTKRRLLRSLGNSQPNGNCFSACQGSGKCCDGFQPCQATAVSVADTDTSRDGDVNHERTSDLNVNVNDGDGITFVHHHNILLLHHHHLILTTVILIIIFIVVLHRHHGNIFNRSTLRATMETR
jgi:hypothetical protein